MRSWQYNEPVSGQMLSINLVWGIWDKGKKKKKKVKQSVQLGIHVHIHCNHSTTSLPLVYLCLQSVKPDTHH
jgi:hypothetical protein